MKFLLVALIVLTSPAFAQTRGKPVALPADLPKVVQEAIEKNNKECTEGKPVFTQGFFSTRDINGDGKPDYVLNYDHYKCGEIETLFCGTGGCQTEIFASDGEGGYVHVWDKLAQKVDFKTIGKRPAMVIHLHGSKCGRNNSQGCRMTLYWNGSEFHPAN
ncbi:MAG: hypothetical protein ABWY35_04395 [Pseudorhodoplanes sp.]